MQGSPLSALTCGAGKGLLLGLLLLASTACGDDDKRDPDCVDGDPRCGAACSVINPCGFGLFCSTDSTCQKQCVAQQGSDPGIACPSGGMCIASGACRGVEAGSGGSGAGGGGTAAAGAGTGGGGAGIGGGDGGNACPDALVRTNRVTPTVVLLVDQSSSMTENFEGDRSRWDVLRDFLLEQPDGLIAGLQSQVRFGFAMYSAISNGTPDAVGECPMITQVMPALDNYAAIEAIYRDADVIQDTPTGDAIDAVIDSLGLATNPDIAMSPVVLVLATDGEPDRCEELNPQNGQEEAIAATRRAYSMGVRTFIISVGDEVSEEHQQDMANAGLGRMPGDPNAEYWEAGNDASLRAALSEIVGTQLGCEVQLSGSVAGGDPCDGEVVLNGQPLTCDDEHGWELSTPRTIRLLGDACETLKSDADVFLSVRFPCTVSFVD